MINLNDFYSVKGWRGVAFYAIKEIEKTKEAVVVMVGDDMERIVDVRDLTKISDDEFCHSCGQIGCHC
jgi:hypothetical protein